MSERYFWWRNGWPEDDAKLMLSRIKIQPAKEKDAIITARYGIWESTLLNAKIVLSVGD